MTSASNAGWCSLINEDHIEVAEKQDDQHTKKPNRGGIEAELIGRIIQSEQKLSEYFTTIRPCCMTQLWARILVALVQFRRRSAHRAWRAWSSCS